MIRISGRLGSYLGASGQEFLEVSSGAISRILPHVAISAWRIEPRRRPGAFWVSPTRDQIRLDLSLGPATTRFSRTVSATISRKKTPYRGGTLANTLDTREHHLCATIARLLSEPLTGDAVASASVLTALRQTFDEQVVAEHIRDHHGLRLDVQAVLRSIHQLAEQTYENRSLAFGCLLDPSDKRDRYQAPVFPNQLLDFKKYRALSDGFRTSYWISSYGHVVDFVDLETFRKTTLSSRHYFPYWSANFAKASQYGVCGISLTRNGDILVFDAGTLRLTYRAGRWQYWNHSHLIALLADLARTQHVPPRRISGLVEYLYTSSLDVSFRHSGGLFVLLRNVNLIDRLVHPRDIMHGPDRSAIDRQFDQAIPRKVFRPILAELAALDGAVVIVNNGAIRAHGAILKQPASSNRYRTEGSRTKAAVGASKYGLAVKVSSDGDITIFHEGKEFIRVG